jgi:CheY-like chemotaxis protein
MGGDTDMELRQPLVMLVDDDVDFLDLNRRVLEQAGYRVACFANRDDALKTLSSEPPDLVITDLMMESFDTGFMFARQIREDARFRDLPIVIVTAVGSKLGLDFKPRNADDLAAMHADAFFEKPVPPKRLVAKVGALLAARKPRIEDRS